MTNSIQQKINNLKIENQNKLEEQIYILEKEEEIKEYIKEDLKVFLSVSSKKDMFFIDLTKEKLEDISSIIKKIIKHYPFVLESYKIDYKGEVINYSPIELNVQSNIRAEDKVVLNYKSNDVDIRITIPIEFYSDDILKSENRKVTSSEHHYYTGLSLNEISKISIPYKVFSVFKSLAYYGGHTKLICPTKEDRANFEFTVVNGHTK